MRTWTLWFLTFVLLEAYALASGTFPTLSQVWRQYRDTLPLPLSVAFTAVTGALFLWLLIPHWLWSDYDREGFDRYEAVLLLVGLVFGALAGRARRPKRRV